VRLIGSETFLQFLLIAISLLHNGAGEDDSHKFAALLTNLVSAILNKFLNNFFYIWIQMYIKGIYLLIVYALHIKYK